MEPEIQKLIAKHKQEIKKLKTLHEAELLQSDERAAQRYVRQTEELKEMLEHEKEEQGQRERELARQRYEGSGRWMAGYQEGMGKWKRAVAVVQRGRTQKPG